MKKLGLVLLIIISCVSFSLDSVTFTSGDWEPYASSKNEDGRVAEILIEEALELEGVEVKYRYFPWKRSLETARKAKSDGAILWFKTDEREKDFYYSSESIIDSKHVLFHKNSQTIDWNNLDDLKNYKIGISIGHKSEKDLKEAGIGYDASPDYKTLFKKLAAGRLDIVICEEIVGYTIMKDSLSDNQFMQITNHEKPIYSSPLYLLVAKSHKDAETIVNSFDKGMSRLKESGNYSEIIDKVKK